MKMTNYVAAGFSLVFVETLEIKRAIAAIERDTTEVPVKQWDLINGINGEFSPLGKQDPFAVIMEMFENFHKNHSKTLILLENFEWFLERKEFQQLLLNYYRLFKNKQICLTIVGTKADLPECLKKIFHVIDFALPSAGDFKEMLEQDTFKPFDIQGGIENSCLGLAFEETENSLAKEAIEKGTVTREGIQEARKTLIDKTGFMKISKPESIDMVAGLDIGKDFLYKRKKAFEPGNSHLPKLRSVLLVGYPGCGKTLLGKAASSIFNCDFIEANINAMKGGIVGETGKNTRHFIKTADAVGFAIFFFDELEKMVSTSPGDPTNAGQIGDLLTWFNDRNSDAIVIATSNDLSALPPEFLRPGRWDAIFFVGFPNLAERKEIIRIMNKKHNSNLDLSLAERLENWTGAEIEQLAKDSHYDDLDTIIETMPTVAKTRKDNIKAMQEKSKFYRPISSNAAKKDETRKLGIH